MTPAEKRVINGAAFFDAVLPGWIDHVNITNLFISSAHRCVASQLVPHLRRAHPDAFSEPDLDGYSLGTPWMQFTAAYPKLCVKFGLNERKPGKLGLIQSNHAGSAELSGAWKDYIRTRRQVARVISDDFASAMPPPATTQTEPKLPSVAIICGGNETVTFPADVYTVIIDGVSKFATLDGMLELVRNNAKSAAHITIEGPK